MLRRTFLQSGALGLSAVGLPNLVGSATKDHQKSIIFLFLAGGMSHAESFNASPDAIDRYKSVNGYVKTKDGRYLGGVWNNLSQFNDYTLVHNFSHQNAGHQGGSVWVSTGYNFNDENQGAAQTHPSYGSVVNKMYGANGRDGIPNYVSNSRMTGLYAAYLGAQNNPFTIDSEGKKNLAINIPVERFTQRHQVLKSLDTNFSSINGLKIVDEHKKQAFDIMFGSSSEAFKIEAESENVRFAYGNTDVGRNLLLARRLVERGSRFITVTHDGWDMHSNIKMGMERLVPEVDRALSTLINELKERGLLETTMVVVSTEFGRTPINQDAGRDHHPRNVPLLISGGKYTGGVIGEMDRNAFEIKGQPYYPVNLLSTILNHMDIPPSTQFTDFSGRPRYILEGQDKRIIQ
jgi:hypothetical protein